MTPELDREKAHSLAVETTENSLDLVSNLFQGGKIDLYEISTLILGERKKTDYSLAQRLALDCIIASPQVNFADPVQLSTMDDSLLDFALQKLAKDFLNGGAPNGSMGYELVLKSILTEKLHREARAMEKELVRTQPMLNH